MNRRAFRTSDLVRVSPAPPPDSPPLFMGEFCRLNSGSPDMLVVDVTAEIVTVSWGDEEYTFPRACVRRSTRSAAP